MLKLGVGGPTTVVETGEGHALSLAHPRLRAEAMKTAEGRGLTREAGRMLAHGEGEIPADTIMATPWSTETGTGLAAVRDDDRTLPWDQYKGNGNGTEIVTTASTGLTWPSGMTNCMLIRVLIPSTVQGVRMTTLPTWPVGTWRYHRFYFAHILPDFGDPAATGTHPFQDAQGGSNTNFEFDVSSEFDDQPGTWWPSIDHNGADTVLGSGAQINKFVLGPRVSGQPPRGEYLLDQDTVYGFEIGFKRESSTTLIMKARVLDASGTILYGPGDWYRQNGNGDTLAEDHEFAIHNASAFSDLQLGSNGWDQDPAEELDAYYWGGYMLRTDDWCGPFDPAEETF